MIQSFLQSAYFLYSIGAGLILAIAWIVRRELQIFSILRSIKTANDNYHKLKELEMQLAELNREKDEIKTELTSISRKLYKVNKNKRIIIDMLTAIINHLGIDIEKHLQAKKHFL